MKTRLSNTKGLAEVNRMSQFAFQAPTARKVSLAGDFNHWNTEAGPMHKGPDGVWQLGVALRPGRYGLAQQMSSEASGKRKASMRTTGTLPSSVSYRAREMSDGWA